MRFAEYQPSSLWDPCAVDIQTSLEPPTSWWEFAAVAGFILSIAVLAEWCAIRVGLPWWIMPSWWALCAAMGAMSGGRERRSAQ